MRLLLQRNPSVQARTIGVLWTVHDDDTRTVECFTCEDQIREIPGAPVSQWKIPRETAIPAGTYPVVVTYSYRFARRLPLLRHVPGFEGIRIHPGNNHADTDGCILPGKQAVTGAGVSFSRAAQAELQAKIEDAIHRGESVTIEIRNPPQDVLTLDTSSARVASGATTAPLRPTA